MVGLLGGSFDPVRRGHLHAARAALGAQALDRVVFVPAAEPPHKVGQRLASGADRLAMVRSLGEWVPEPGQRRLVATA